MTINNFRASDFRKGETPVKMVRSSRDVFAEPVPTTQPIVSPDADPEDVPVGAVPEVLTWVGEDPERAQKALDVELQDAKPRKGLVAQLSGLIDAESKPEVENSDDEN